MQTISRGDYLHEVSKSIFWKNNNKKKHLKMSSTEIFTQSAKCMR